MKRRKDRAVVQRPGNEPSYAPRALRRKAKDYGKRLNVMANFTGRYRSWRES